MNTQKGYCTAVCDAPPTYACVITCVADPVQVPVGGGLILAVLIAALAVLYFLRKRKK